MTQLIEISKLREHEKTNDRHMKKLMKEIIRDNLIKEPIIVEKETLVILDGHHRTKIARALGLTKIPAYLINYNRVRLRFRRKDYKADKKTIIRRAFERDLLPAKTTEHILKKPKPVNIKLDELR